MKKYIYIKFRYLFCRFVTDIKNNIIIIRKKYKLRKMLNFKNLKHKNKILKMNMFIAII